jgi:hypothetical protein
MLLHLAIIVQQLIVILHQFVSKVDKVLLLALGDVKDVHEFTVFFIGLAILH